MFPNKVEQAVSPAGLRTTIGWTGGAVEAELTSAGTRI